MNPDSGKIHEIEDEGGRELLRASRAKGVEETVEQRLKRAQRRAEALMSDSEPAPGTEVPDDWPRFSVGDLVPWKGWFFRVELVDVDEQRVVLKPFRPTKSTIERRVGSKKRKKRKKGGRR